MVWPEVTIPIQVLNVESNSIHALPEQIGALTKLERLQMASNALISLPISFTRLQALKVLSLARNKFATVPDEIGACSRLEELDLSDNCLQVGAPHQGLVWSSFLADNAQQCRRQSARLHLPWPGTPFLPISDLLSSIWLALLTASRQVTICGGTPNARAKLVGRMSPPHPLFAAWKDKGSSYEI